MLGWNFLMSSAQAASRIERGAKTNVLPSRCEIASRTARVLPVPGSEVIKQRGWVRTKRVVST